ncbi:MAG: GDSL-type esterase/lipase family protein [Thiotrichaceae bacterium]|nr:GDSL-type esterase/lipase family protein [Thiotrichaceae bacterium]
MHNKNYPISFYLLIPLITTLFSVLLIELAFNLIYPIPFSVERGMFCQADPYTSYRLKPNVISYAHNTGYSNRINAYGHRDQAVKIPKPDNVFRILLLGDSFTIGAKMREDQAYPYLLEKSLDKQLKNKKVEVVNAGVGGWQPFQYAQYYQHYGQQFQADMILVGLFVGNDTYAQETKIEHSPTAVMGQLISREKAQQTGIRWKIWLYEHSNLIRLMLNKGATSVNHGYLRKNCQDFNSVFLQVQTHRLANHLKRSPVQEQLIQNTIIQIQRIQNIAVKTQIPVIIALLPDETQINPVLQQTLLIDKNSDNYDFKMPQSLLTEKLTEINLQNIDLLPAFLQDSRCLYMNDTHWTAEGHQLVAKTLTQAILPLITE